MKDIHHHRTHSSSSLVEVDESPSRFQSRRPKQFLPSPQLSPYRKTPSKTPTKPHHFTLNIEPSNNEPDIESGPISGSLSTSKSTLKLHEKSEVKGKKSNEPSSLSASRLQVKRVDRKTQSRRDSVLRKLVFDETNDDDVLPASNPCYIND